MRPQTLAAAIFALIATTATGQLAPHQLPKPHPTEATAHTDTLPVTHVSLYKNGVGFFEHTGRVTGDASVTIDFTSGQLNDVLQSLTAIDLNGGRISGAGYNSTTPLAQQLQTLPLSLDANPTVAGFYGGIRGSRIEVRTGAVTITGRLLSIETGDTIGTGKTESNDSPDKLLLTVISDAGEVHTVVVTANTSVRLLDPALDANVNRYLKLLDANRSQGLRHLTLADNGTGSRELRVSYISEVPIWKSTYRILFTGSKSDTQTATLQGWSVVDNTTGTDWINVKLSLIAGAPQSFIQPLSQPIYSHRPEIAIAQEAQLTPQTFQSGFGSGSAGGVMGGVMGMPFASDSVNVTDQNTLIETQSASMAMLAPQSRSIRNNYRPVPSPAAKMPAPPPTPPPSYEALANDSFTANTQSNAFDDFFAYNLTEPVTIRKNESALVPTLQTKVEAERVTVVHSNGAQLSQPLRALWLTNNSNLTLDRGSFSIVEDGNFGGEGLLDPIHPNEKRLLSYAADQAVHVSTENPISNNHVDRITASHGVLIIQRAEHSAVTYVVRNAAAEPRTIVLEHPVRSGFTLDASARPDETTADVYRFRIHAAAGETVRLPIATDHRAGTSYVLTSTDDSQFALILQQSNNDPAVAAAIQPILEARRKAAEADAAVDQTQTRLDNLHSNEDRQRANITALHAADKSARDRFVNDLTHTEDEIVATQKEMDTRTTAKEQADADLANKIEALQLNQPL